MRTTTYGLVRNKKKHQHFLVENSPCLELCNTDILSLFTGCPKYCSYKWFYHSDNTGERTRFQV